jgi:hypothetical protein
MKIKPLDMASARPISLLVLAQGRGWRMEVYRVREVKIIDTGNDGIKLKPLREYERQSSDQAGIIEQVRHFFEMELSSPKAPQTIDFDAIIIVDANGAEIARFSVSDFWMREWNDVAFGADKLPPPLKAKSASPTQSATSSK